LAISIEWGTKVINVNKIDMTLIQSVPTTIYELNLNGFRATLNDLQDGEEGMSHATTHEHNPPLTVGGVTLARTIELINGYTVTFEDDQYAVNLVGANSNVGDNVNVNQVSVRSSNSAGLISSADIEFASFNGGVIIDVDSGNIGTLYPAGTEREKCSLMSDVLIIAAYRGFNKIYLHSDITLGADADLVNFIIEGRSHVQTDVYIDPAADVSGGVFTECNISGTLDGDNSLTICIVGDINYLNGHIHSSALNGKITLGGGKDAYMVNCSQLDMDVTPEIDMGGSGQDLVMPDYTGIVLISNLTGGNKAGIGLDGGIVILDTSTVTDGLIHISGNGGVTDELGNHIDTGTWNGGVTVINDAMSKDTIAESVWSSIEGEIVKKMLYNKVDKSGDIITIYDDDDVAIWKQFDLSNDGRVEV